MKATTCAVALFVLVAMSVSVKAAESLAAARELYASAWTDTDIATRTNRATAHVVAFISSSCRRSAGPASRP